MILGLYIGNAENPVTVNIEGGFTTTTGYVTIDRVLWQRDMPKINLQLNLYKEKDDITVIKSTDFSNDQILDCTTEDIYSDIMPEVVYDKLIAVLEYIYGEGKIFKDES